MTPGGLIALLGPFATYVEENRPAGGRRFLDARDHFAAQLIAAWPDIEACLVEAKAAGAELEHREVMVDRLEARLAAAEAVCRIVDAEHTCDGCENDRACEPTMTPDELLESAQKLRDAWNNLIARHHVDVPAILAGAVALEAAAGRLAAAEADADRGWSYANRFVHGHNLGSRPFYRDKSLHDEAVARRNQP